MTLNDSTFWTRRAQRTWIFWFTTSAHISTIQVTFSIRSSWIDLLIYPRASAGMIQLTSTLASFWSLGLGSLPLRKRIAACSQCRQSRLKRGTQTKIWKSKNTYMRWKNLSEAKLTLGLWRPQVHGWRQLSCSSDAFRDLAERHLLEIGRNLKTEFKEYRDDNKSIVYHFLGVSLQRNLKVLWRFHIPHST